MTWYFSKYSNGVAHIGICLYVSGGRIYTVEGNTSDSSGLETNGGGVYFKNYSLSTSYINGYGVLPYKSNSSVAKIDYSGKNPTPGLYVANATKYIYGSETDTTYDYLLPRFTMFEVTQVCSNGRLKIVGKCSTGETVTGYITNNSDRVIQLSTSETNVADTARADLQKAVNTAKTIRHYNYTEAKILEIREAYTAAVALLGSTSSSADAMQSATTKLNNLLAQTGSNTIALNNQGIYINGRNGVIGAGDCFIYSNLWNNGLITVDNANIRYTVNVVCGWDAQQEINVVKSVTFGKGNSTPSIQLGEAEWLIACHDWETGISSGDNPVVYSGTNYKILSNLSVGDRVLLSGATALNANSDVSPAAFLKFIPKDATLMDGENAYVGNGKTVLFTPDFNAGLLTPDNANIHRTLNVLAQWDNDKAAWMVVGKSYGSGVAGASSNIELQAGQVLIASHVGTSTSDVYNYNMLDTVKVGQKVIFSGISPTDGSTAKSISANISFVDYAGDDSSDDTQTESVNLVSGKDYIAKLPGTAAHTAGLTDGVYTTALNTTGGWFGFLSVAESANYNTDEQGVGYVTFDLGARHNLDSLRAHVFAGANSAGIGTPSFIQVYTSVNGTEYAYAGELAVNTAASAPYWASLADVGITARYVRFGVGPATDAAWVFLNELEVYGTALTGSENIAADTAYQGDAADGYNGSLTDGVVGTAITDGSWYGVPTNGSVVIDLFDRYQISDVKAHLYAGEGVTAPTAVSVSLSSDGVSYAKVGELTLETATAPYWASLNADTMVGRYVKLETQNEAVTLMSEIQVYGTAYTGVGTDNIGLGKTFVVSGYADSPFTALLNDSLASDVFQYNVNNGSWFAFRNTGTAEGSNVSLTNNRGLVTIDLGGQAEISNIATHLFAGSNDAGVTQPGYVNIYYSVDGMVYDYALTVNPDKTATAPYWQTSQFDTPLTARYIKMAYSVGVGQLVLLNEIKITGAMLTVDEPNKPGTVSGVTLAGSFNGWNSTPNMVNVNETTVSAVITLEAGSHEFKVLHDNRWYGNNGTINGTTGENGWIMEESANNCVINAPVGGEYRFTFNRETQQLWVTLIPETVYLRGSFNEWGTDLVMTPDEDGTYSATVQLAAGKHEFKVANADYTAQWPTENYVLELGGKAEVTVTLNIYNNSLTVDYTVEEATVTFVDYDGTVLDTGSVAMGAMPTLPAEPQRAADETYTYTFSGWSPEVTAVTGDATYTATYTATLIPKITAKYPSLSFEGEIYCNVYFATAGMEDVPLTDMGLAIFSSNLTGGTVADAVELVPGAKDAGSLLCVKTNGIPAKKLGDTIYFKVYARLANGEYVYSNTYSYSAVDYAKDRLANSSNQQLKALCVAMLNYGAAAQQHFGYGSNNLMNAFLSETQQGFVESYRSDMVANVGTVDSNKLGIFTKSGFGPCYPSVTFEGAFAISYYFTPVNKPDNGMKLYYWDLNTYNSVDTLTKENATGVVDMAVNGSAYKGTVTGIAAKEVDETIFVSGVYECDGVTCATGVLPYSLGAYCVDRAANGNTETMQALAAATAVYGYYAKIYFANN